MLCRARHNPGLLLALQVLLLAQLAMSIRWVTVKSADKMPRNMVTYAEKKGTHGICRIKNVAAGRISMFSKLCYFAYHGPKTVAFPYQTLTSDSFSEQVVWKDTKDAHEIMKHGVKVLRKVKSGPKMYVCAVPNQGPGTLMIYGNNEMECMISIGMFEHAEKRNFKVLIVEPPTEMKITHVKYSLDRLKILSEKPTHMADADLENNDNSEQLVTHKLQYTKTSKNTWNNKVGVSFGVKTKVSAGIPAVVDGEFEVSASSSFEYNSGGANTETVAVSLQATVGIAPRHVCHVEIVAKQIMVNVPYSGKVTTYFKDGSKKTKRMSGVYDGVSVSHDTVVVDRCVALGDA